MVKHIVVFKYKSGVSESQVGQCTEAFRSLKDKIPGILAFEHGPNISPEKRDQGFNHVYLVTFDTEASRDAYLPHPAHKAFAGSLGELLDDVFVIDYQPCN